MLKNLSMTLNQYIITITANSFYTWGNRIKLFCLLLLAQEIIKERFAFRQQKYSMCVLTLTCIDPLKEVRELKPDQYGLRLRKYNRKSFSFLFFLKSSGVAITQRILVISMSICFWLFASLTAECDTFPYAWTEMLVVGKYQVKCLSLHLLQSPSERLEVGVDIQEGRWERSRHWMWLGTWSVRYCYK